MIQYECINPTRLIDEAEKKIQRELQREKELAGYCSQPGWGRLHWNTGGEPIRDHPSDETGPVCGPGLSALKLAQVAQKAEQRIQQIQHTQS